MILATHSDTAYLNETHSHSRAGLHILWLDNYRIPCDSGPVLYLSQIINVFMPSASEEEIAWLFITDKAMVPLWLKISKKLNGHNLTPPSKHATPQQMDLTIKTLSPRKQSKWIWDFTGSNAANPKANLDTTRP